MKRLLKVSVLTGMLTLLRMFAGFIVAKVVAIYTGPSGLALLGQIQNIITGLNGIINAPVSSGIVKYTAQNYIKGFEACSPWWRASIYWISMLIAFILPIGLIFSRYISEWLLHDSSLSWIIIIIITFYHYQL